MSLWSRIANVVRGDRLSREIDEELESHIDEAIEQGRDPGRSPAGIRLARCGSAKRAATSGSCLARFAARRRRLRLAAAHEEKGTSAAAILSLALGDRGLHVGVPAHRRPAAAAFAGGGVRSGSTLSPGRRQFGRWQAQLLRRLGLSGVPSDARCGEGSSGIDRGLLRASGSI